MSIHRVEISRSALRANVAVFRRLAPDSQFMAVVKSNAYGHDLELVVEALSGQVDWFGVNSLHEAERLRRVDAATPVLVMGLNACELREDRAIREKFFESAAAATSGRAIGAGTAAHAGLTFVVSSRAMLEFIQQEAPATPFHLKIDTGLSRLGVWGSELRECLEFLAAHPDLAWTGVMTHFANVEDVTDQTYAGKQLERFAAARSSVQAAAGARSILYHAAASAPALILPESRLDLIRVGISLYGLWPSPQTRLSMLSQLGELPRLRPALRWTVRIVHVHPVRAGESVGYGCTYQTPADTRVATLPVGYYEGYERALSNRAHVLVRGRRARVLGRVSMNMIVVDVGHIPGVVAGEEAVLLGSGSQGGSSERLEEITADSLAELTGTIHYDVVTRINANLPRVLVDD